MIITSHPLKPDLNPAWLWRYLTSGADLGGSRVLQGGPQHVEQLFAEALHNRKTYAAHHYEIAADADEVLTREQMQIILAGLAAAHGTDYARAIIVEHHRKIGTGAPVYWQVLLPGGPRQRLH